MGKNTSIAKKKSDIEEISEAKIMEYAKQFLSKDLRDDEMKKFVSISREFNLNPFKREIYAVAYGTGEQRTLSLIVGFEVYLKRAERSGLLNGWKVWTEGKRKDNNLKAVIEISRKDWDQPFLHEVWYDEYKKETLFWKSRPVTMLKKVCLSQGFRLAFPDELGGIPYTEDEIEAPVPDKDKSLPLHQPEKEVKKEEETKPATKTTVTEKDTDKLVNPYDQLRRLAELSYKEEKERVALYNKVKSVWEANPTLHKELLFIELKERAKEHASKSVEEVQKEKDVNAVIGEDPYKMLLKKLEDCIIVQQLENEYLEVINSKEYKLLDITQKESLKKFKEDTIAEWTNKVTPENNDTSKSESSSEEEVPF